MIIHVFIQQAATLTFDYLALLIIASVIAGIGLAVNSTVSIVASMLVSPIMGPVLALTFGSVINNYKLMRLGMISELFSLFVCICVGFIIGIASIGVGTDGFDKYSIILFFSDNNSYLLTIMFYTF